MRRAALLLLAAALLLPGVARAQGDEEAAPIRFRPVDVYVDPHGQPLAAYQVEITAAGSAMIVGVEGGAAPAFAWPPHHDPAALTHKRIIIAAFSTDAALPTGRTRVATVHMRESGPGQPTYRATLQVAGGPDGRPIHATVDLEPEEGDRR